MPEPKKPHKNIHSELHEFIAETRKDFGDTATKGVGSFGFYLRVLKKVPLSTLYIIRGSVRDSNAREKAKLFFWKIKQWKTPPVKDEKLSTDKS